MHLKDGQFRARRPLDKNHDIFVFEHQWTFLSADQAATQLNRSPGLSQITRLHILDALTRYIPLVPGLQRLKTQLENEESSSEDTVRNIVDGLFSVACQYQLATSEGESQTYYYVMLDTEKPKQPELPTCLKFEKKDPLMKCVVFIDMDQSQAFTLCFPIEDVEPHRILTRNELTIMPNYSRNEYWQLHYHLSSPPKQSFDWFIDWEKLGPILEHAIGKGPERTLLDLGCGNSKIGAEIVRAKLAGFAVHVDISLEAIREVSDEMKLNDYIVMDAADPAWRPSQLFDLVVDKGTLDGIMYQNNALEVLKRIWDELKGRMAANGRLALISLGSPESRFSVVEQHLGWRIEQAFEVSDPNSVSGIKKCFLYICAPQ